MQNIFKWRWTLLWKFLDVYCLIMLPLMTIYARPESSRYAHFFDGMLMMVVIHSIINWEK